MKFIDEVRLTAASGKGGDGLVAFRREKFVPKGGPSGGDGGRGGHIVFRASRHLNTLLRLRFTPIIKADKGTAGGPNRRTGAQGKDRIVEVPVGTLIKSESGDQLLADLSEDAAEFLALEGGRGGKGNAHFTSSTRRAPDFAKDGRPGNERIFRLELKLLAEVGLLGYPNAGKSTLISRLSAARPKVASYPFTTLVPSLGVVKKPDGYNSFVMADIPGLIDGAAEGAGLGHRFLRHVERCKLLLHLISLDPMDAEAYGEPLLRFDSLSSELKRYAAELAGRPQVVLLSKSDLSTAAEIDAVRAMFVGHGHMVVVASSVTGEGLDDVVYTLCQALDDLAQPPEEPEPSEPPLPPHRHPGAVSNREDVESDVE